MYQVVPSSLQEEHVQSKIKLYSKIRGSWDCIPAYELCFSGYLPLYQTVAAERHPANLNVPIFGTRHGWYSGAANTCTSITRFFRSAGIWRWVEGVSDGTHSVSFRNWRYWYLVYKDFEITDFEIANFEINKSTQIPGRFCRVGARTHHLRKYMNHVIVPSATRNPR